MDDVTLPIDYDDQSFSEDVYVTDSRGSIRVRPRGGRDNNPMDSRWGVINPNSHPYIRH